MNKLKTFFYSFKRSLTDISYYRDVLKAPFSFSWKYLYMLSLVIMFIYSVFTVVAMLAVMPQLPEFIDKAKTVAREAYPSELVVTVENGEVSTNVEEPYFIDFPEFTESNDMEGFKHVVTIDTAASIEDYANYETLVLITQNAIVYPRKTGNDMTMQFNYFSEDTNMVINRQFYDQLMAKLLPYLDYLPTLMWVAIAVVLFIGPFIAALLNTLGYMLYLLITSLIVWLVSMFFKTGLGYQKIYQLGMHGLTLPIVAAAILELFNVNIPNLFTAGFLLWMVVILSKMKGEHQVAKVDTKNE